MNDPSLEQRQELASQGLLSVETETGEFVAAKDAYLCPELCGAVFASEEAYRDFCPDECHLKAKEVEAAVKAAENQETHTVYIAYGHNGQALKAVVGSEELQTIQNARWWRDVFAVAARHFRTAEDATASLGAIRRALGPVYDVDPKAMRVPRPLSERIPEQREGPNEIHVAFRVSDALESRINAAAEAAGLTRPEWLRRACALYSVAATESDGEPDKESSPTEGR